MNHGKYHSALTIRTRNRATVLAQLMAFHQCLCPICDKGIDPCKCCACQDERVTHSIAIDSDNGFSTGSLCLLCYATLALSPLPQWLTVEPLLDCLHLNRTAKGSCRDCKMRAKWIAEEAERRRPTRPVTLAAESTPARPSPVAAAPVAPAPVFAANYSAVICTTCGANINENGLLAGYAVKKCNGRYGHELARAAETTFS